MIEKENFGQMLVDLRKKKNMTQKELAEKLCITPAAVSKWEHGQHYPDITLIPKIAEILDVSCDTLLYSKKPLTDLVDVPNPLRNTKDTCQSDNLPSKPAFNNICNFSIVIVAGLILVFTIIGIVVAYTQYKQASSFPFQIVSQRSTEDFLSQKTYEISVLLLEEPSTEEYNQYYTKLRDDYENGVFGDMSFNTMKILFYSVESEAYKFEESEADLVSYLYFEIK